MTGFRADEYPSEDADLHWSCQPRSEHTMTDLMRQYRARQEPAVCWAKTCWCGHLMPDWLELCFTCKPGERDRWVK
jgi:hypothetical protein